jgi:hypothetical protein
MAPPFKKPTTEAPHTNKRIEFVNKRANQEGFKTFGKKSALVQEMFKNNKPPLYTLSEAGKEKMPTDRDYNTPDMQKWLGAVYETHPQYITRNLPAGDPSDDNRPSSSKRARIDNSPTITDDSSPDNTQSSRGSVIQVNDLADDSGLFDDFEMGLPGTGQGQGGSGDGNANSGMPLYKSIKPYTDFNSKTTTYRKVHRLMTFGLAHVGLTGTATSPTETQRWITTYLASIPWHKPYFYMSPGEYNILGENAKVKSLKITVTHRGNRIAFNTASSESQLATLNNVQNVAIAYGLNKTGFGQDMLPDFTGTTNPMIPTKLAFNEYNQGYVNSWYGYPQGATDWGLEMPDVFLGYKSLLRNYFNMCSTGNNTTGDPMLAKHLMIADGKTTINQVLGEFEYHPKMAPLKRESQFVRYALPIVNDAQTTINIEGNVHSQRTLSLDLNNSTPTAQYVEGTLLQRTLNNSSLVPDLPNAQGVYDAESFYFKNIEKANYMRQIIWGDVGDKTHVQPSVHVGIQAIPSLSTAALALAGSNSYTDSQADWEVTAEMVVDEGLGVDFAWSQAGNKAFHDVTMVTQEPSNNAVIIGGRFPTNSIRPSTVNP